MFETFWTYQLLPVATALLVVVRIKYKPSLRRH